MEKASQVKPELSFLIAYLSIVPGAMVIVL